MQGQRSSVGSVPEIEFDHGPTLINDQQVCWNTMLNPVDAPSLPECVRSPTDANVVGLDIGGLAGWNVGGPVSSDYTLGQTSHDEAKVRESWTPSSTANAGSRSEETQFEAANILSSENVDINLNINQSANAQLFLQNSNVNDSAQSSDHNAALVCNSVHISEAGKFHFVNHSSSDTEQIRCAGGSYSCESSSAGFACMPEYSDGRPGPLDGRCLSRKRKSIEAFSEQSSLNRSPSCFQQSQNSSFHVVSAQHHSTSSSNPSGSSDNLSGVNTSEEQLNPRIGDPIRRSTECHSPVSLAGNAETSQRNLRMRINSARQHDSAPNMWLPGNPIRHSNSWSLTLPPPLLVPINQFQTARPIVASARPQTQSLVPTIPVLPQTLHRLPLNGTHSSRISSSSNSSAISGERAGTIRQEINPRSLPRNPIPEHSLFVPTTSVRHLVQGPTNLSLSNRNISITGNTASTSQVGPSSGVQPSLLPTYAAQQNSPTRCLPSLSDLTHRSFLPSGASNTGVQSSNLLPQHSGQSNSHELIPQPGTGRRGLQQSFWRSAMLVDRPNDSALGVSLALRNLATGREGRSRVISEIRNALELMHRGENLRLEDVMFLDQAIFYGGADMHDRHRNMRLDVDNMTYEELLALEERIGNVSTGLSEEKLMKCLKQLKYFSITVEASTEVEPCCICQEEYLDGEDLGKLDCGHDFHTDCIKQWLKLKNLCPICKMTALVT